MNGISGCKPNQRGKGAILCLRWYFRYELSYRDPVEMMAARGLSVAHTTILRWSEPLVR